MAIINLYDIMLDDISGSNTPLVGTINYTSLNGISTISTDNLLEGSNNLFYTNDRVDTRINTNSSVLNGVTAFGWGNHALVGYTTTSYVDNLITGITWKNAVTCATTTDITLSGEQIIDDVLTSGSRVLVKNQTTESQNGIYLTGSGAWTRTVDADSSTELISATVLVDGGTINANTQWTCSNTTLITIDTTSITFVQIAGVGTYSAGNGLSIEDNVIKLGGVLTDGTTVIEGDSTKSFKIGKFENGANLGFFGVYSQAIEFSQFIDHTTFQGNNLVITPGGLISRNSFFNYQETAITNNPIAAILRFSDNKIVSLNLFGGVNVGESITINGVTFTEGIDFISQADASLDALSIANIDYSSIPNFVSVAVIDTSTLVYTFTENSTIETSIVNSFLQTHQNHRKVLVDEDGVLLKSRNNEITLTDTDTIINSKNVNIIQKNEEGVIKNTVFSNSYGSFLWNTDSTDSSVSSSSVVGNFGSNISNSNNRKIGLSIVGEILSGESFTVNGITFTEGIDFTTVNDPNLDALAISEIDYSSVPNFISVSVETNFITFTFSVVDNTITTTISNVYVVNYLSNSSVFAGKNFAAIQSNNSELRIGYEGHTFTDNTSEKQGIRYAGDYSATYTDRSLVDKEYADSLNTNAVDKDTVKLAENINKGQAVYVSGANGTNIIVSKASNTTEATSSKTFGLLESSGVTNDFVNVVTRGLLTGLDTSTATIGDAVWLGTDGNLIYGLTNKPYAPAHLVFVGIVTRVQSENGEIFVNIQNGFELNEIHNVSITTPTNNQALIYENSTGLWKNKEITSVGTITSGTWNGSVIDSAYLPSYVDDVLEYTNLASLPVTGESGKIYVTLDTNKIYRWSGSVYVEISSSTIPNLQAVTDVSSSTTNNITANGFVKSGGTSSQFLKADGSVDSNTYLTSNQTITLSGDISGSGTNSITTSIGAGKVTNTMLAGSIDLTTKVTGVLPSNLGGTGVANNPAYTITLGGAMTTSNNVIIGSSNHTVSLNTTGNTSITLPTSGTLSTLAGTETLTNKRVTTRVGIGTNIATQSINTDNVDYYEVTGLTTNIGFALSGTPTNGQKLWISITGTASRTITWTTLSFEASTIALPTTTVGTARLDVGFIWNTATSKWRCVGAC